MEPGIEEMKKNDKGIKMIESGVFILIIWLISVALIVGNYTYKEGYKQGQLDALQSKYTYLMVDGKILKVIGEEKK